MVIVFWSNMSSSHFGDQCGIWEQAGFFEWDRVACKLHSDFSFLFIVVLVGLNLSSGEVLTTSQEESSAA